MKIYEKPDVEHVSLIAKETITSGESLLDGLKGVASSEFE